MQLATLACPTAFKGRTETIYSYTGSERIGGKALHLGFSLHGVSTARPEFFDRATVYAYNLAHWQLYIG
ncbi:hypothetical protein L1887_11155 [Cichorium endivia]|nr:hypothetical protein L1887_11155 [Cichorium endivia]